MWRLILLALAAVGLLSLIRAFLAKPALPGADPRALAEGSPELAEARAREEAIHELLALHTEGESLAEELHEIVPRLEEIVEIRARIDRALADRDPARLESERAAAAARVEAAVDLAAQTAAEETLRRVEEHARTVSKLVSRRQTLDATAQRILVELESLELGLLDAVASKTSLGAEDLDRAKGRLQEVRDELARQASAEREVASLLAGG